MSIKKLNRKKKTIIAIVIFIILALIFGYIQYTKAKSAKSVIDSESNQVEYTVKLGNIEKSITGSSSIEPSDTRIVLSEIEGTISKIYAEEGQMVKKDDVLSLYEVESDDASEQLRVDTAELSYINAKKTLSDLTEKLGELKVIAMSNGTLKLLVSEGDTVNTNVKIAEINEINVIKTQSFFTQAQIKNITVGDKAEIFISDNLITLEGIVTSVDRTPVATGNGSVGYLVKVDIDYNGALPDGSPVKITIVNSTGSYASPFSGKTISNDTESINAPYNGEISQLNFSSGDYVKKGDLVAVINSDNLTNEISQQKLVVEQKRIDLDNLNSQNSSVTSPINGTVLTVSVDEQGYVVKGTQLFKIANLNDMEVKIDVDELDIMSISKGQEVTIKCGVFENQTFNGKVKSISLSGTNQNGVTTYQVTIAINDRKELMSGMNVDVEIMIAQKSNVLVAPVAAITKIGSKYVVMTKNAEGNLLPSPVEVGIINDKFIEITSGIKEGDLIYYQVAGTQSSNNGLFFPGMGGGGRTGPQNTTRSSGGTN